MTSWNYVIELDCIQCVLTTDDVIIGLFLFMQTRIEISAVRAAKIIWKHYFY